MRQKSGYTCFGEEKQKMAVPDDGWYAAIEHGQNISCSGDKQKPQKSQ